MENNQRNSRKRLNSLILLVAFTAVMLIVSTYAWFSTQKNVTLTGLKGVVNVAEGLQISLDAEHWVNTINFNDFDQTDAGAWKVKNTATSTYLNTDMTFQSPRGAAGGITNVTPTELLPVSTTGYSTTTDGIGQTAVKFYEGTNTETIKLMDDTEQVTEDATGGFFAFDLFVMNTSAGAAEDVLQLDPVSDVRGDNESTGVQNTARVGFALYDNQGGVDMTISGSNQVTPAQIITASSGSQKIKDFAIWEPNADQHADAIVASLANSLKLDSAEHAKWSGLGTADANTAISKFTSTQKLPTYALTSGSVPGTPGDGSTVHIADVYDWRTTDSAATAAKGVKKQFTLQTDSYGNGSDLALRAAPVNLVSTKKLEANAAAPDTTFTILPNKYQRIRVYFWMEGQDPDCINSASLGGGLTLDIGFSKPGQDNSSAAS